jgi:hypothetical protein
MSELLVLCTLSQIPVTCLLDVVVMVSASRSKLHFPLMSRPSVELASSFPSTTVLRIIWTSMSELLVLCPCHRYQWPVLTSSWWFPRRGQNFVYPSLELYSASFGRQCRNCSYCALVTDTSDLSWHRRDGFRVECVITQGHSLNVRNRLPNTTLCTDVIILHVLCSLLEDQKSTTNWTLLFRTIVLLLLVLPVVRRPFQEDPKSTTKSTTNKTWCSVLSISFVYLVCSYAIVSQRLLIRNSAFKV